MNENQQYVPEGEQIDPAQAAFSRQFCKNVTEYMRDQGIAPGVLTKNNINLEAISTNGSLDAGTIVSLSKLLGFRVNIRLDYDREAKLGPEDRIPERGEDED